MTVQGSVRERKRESRTGSLNVVTVEEMARLEEIVRSTEWLMRALIAAREVGAPDWLIASGAVRTAVWDQLHGYDVRTGLADVDLVFFDPDDLSEGREREVERRLDLALPELPWEATNQAAVHVWYPPGSVMRSNRSARPQPLWPPGPRPRYALG